MNTQNPPPAGRRPIVSCPPEHPPVLLMLHRVRLCNQRPLQPVPNHPPVIVLVVPDEPDEPLLRDTLKTEISHDLLDYSVLRIFPHHPNRLKISRVSVAVLQSVVSCSRENEVRGRSTAGQVDMTQSYK